MCVKKSFSLTCGDVAEKMFCTGMGDYQAERRVRVHLERKLVELTQVKGPVCLLKSSLC